MELRPLTSENMETVRVWRHGVPESLRTTQMLTAEMQQQYYRDVICNRQSGTRYWALWEVESHPDYPPDTFIGYGGIEHISWENGNGEISLMLGPDYRGKGYGKQAVGLFLERAFGPMGLSYVYGECYECAPWEFWARMCTAYGCVDAGDGAWAAFLPMRKEREHGSYYFTFSAEEYRNHTGADRQQGNPA